MVTLDRLAECPASPIADMGEGVLTGYGRLNSGNVAASGETRMAKGQQRSNKEARKPKKPKVKTIAANPSEKGGRRGLENLKND